MSRFRKGTRLAQSGAVSETRSIKSAVDEFLALHVRKGSGERYREELTSYLVGAGRRSRWQPLTRWCAASGLQTVSALDTATLSAYLVETRAAVGQNVYFKLCSILRLFLNFLVSQGFLPTLPLDVVRPKRLKAGIRVFTQDEIRRLADVVKSENARDWAIFLLLLDTGIRATELCSLRLSDVHNERQELTIRASVAKNKSERTVPLSASLPALRKYLKLRGSSSDQTGSFFLSFYSTPVFAGGPHRARRRPLTNLSLSASPLTRVGLYFLIRKWGQLAGLTESRCSPHTFRHYFATQYLRNGGDIVSLQQILGHSRLDVTERYLRFRQEDVKRAHQRYSPAALLLPSRAYRLTDTPRMRP
jgi:integrase/recombinase XerD